MLIRHPYGIHTTYTWHTTTPYDIQGVSCRCRLDVVWCRRDVVLAITLKYFLHILFMRIISGRKKILKFSLGKNLLWGKNNPEKGSIFMMFWNLVASKNHCSFLSSSWDPIWSFWRILCEKFIDSKKNEESRKKTGILETLLPIFQSNMLRHSSNSTFLICSDGIEVPQNGFQKKALGL